jgi:gliding motility-associated-like protein
MKFLRLLLPLLAVLALSTTKVEATHVMGSDFQWECIGKDTFKITVQVYRDCNGVNLSATPVTAYSNCGTKRLNTTRNGGRDITPVCDEQCTRCDSRGCSFKYGIEVYELTTILIVSDWRKNGCCEVTLTWSQCCRNGAITTGAANQNFYVEAKLNICQDPCDNSPTFTGDPLAIICLGRDFIYNQGVQDKDIDPNTGGLADSLVYSWAEPLTSATAKTTWSSNYSYNKPLYYLGFPKTGLKFPRGMHLDSATGDMMFRPMKVEQTVMSIKIESYRKGKLTAQVTRDIQVVVIKCPDNNPPVISGINCKQPKPQNFKTQACAGEKLCFTVCTSDKDKDDTVTIGWNAGIPGATFTVINKGDKRETGRFCWTPSEAQVSKFPYTFVVNAKDNACPVNGFSARSFQIVVKEPPKAEYDTLIYDCGDARFTARKVGRINISQYMWNLSGRVVVHRGGAADTVWHHYKYPGQKPFTLTLIGGNGCNRIYQDTVTVPDFVNVTTTPDQTVCAGSTVKLSATVADNSGKYTVDWSTGDSYTDEGGTTSITVGTKDTFVVAYVEDEQCKNSDTTFIWVNNPATFDLGDEVRICPADKHLFKPTITWDTTETDTVFTYAWYQDNPGGAAISRADSIIVDDSATYFLVVSDSLMCESIDSVSLKVNPDRDWLPTIEPVCLKDSVHAEVSETSPGSTFEWWYTPDSSSTPFHIGEKYDDLQSQSYYYYMRWTETKQGLTCSEYDSVFVKIKDLPEIKMLKPADICENGDDFPLTFNATPYGGEWFDTVSNVDFIRQSRFYPGLAGADGLTPKLHMLFYTYEDPITQCRDTNAISITVKPLPEVELNEEKVPMCNTEDPRPLNQYVANNTGNPNPAGTWSGPGVQKVGNDYVFDASLVNYIQGEYMLIYNYVWKSGAQPHCDNSDTLIINLIEVPAVIAGDYDSVCVDALEFNLENNSPQGPTGAWYYRGTDRSKWDSVSNEFDPNAYGVEEHFFAYVYTVPGSECRDTGYTSLRVNPLPQPEILTQWDQGAGLNKICFSDDPKLLEGNEIENGFSYTNRRWDGRGVRALSGNRYEFNPNTAGLGEHTLTYTVTNIFGCVQPITEEVTVDGIKDVTFTNERVCNGDTVQLNTTIENSEEVIWTTDGEGRFIDPSAINARYIAEGKDLDPDLTFQLKVTTVNPDNVCAEAEYESTVRVHPLPKVVFDSEDTVCAPSEVVFYNRSSIRRGNMREYFWEYGDGNTQTVTGERKVTSNVYGVIGTSDKYTVTLTITSDEDCKASASKEIVTLLSPEAAYRPQPGVTTIIRPEIYFKNLSNYVAEGSSRYEWNFDDFMIRPDGGVSEEENPQYRYTDTGTYEVRLVATNFHPSGSRTYECSDTLIRTIKVRPEIIIHIPNAFTPDNKGIEDNETFKPVVQNVSNYSVQVFNRWGQMMWESENIDESWDGTANGVMCMPDVYLYVVKATNIDGNDYEFTGTVTLIR